MDNFLNEMNNNLKKTIISVDKDPFFMEDSYLKRYKRKALVMKFGDNIIEQKGGDYNDVTKNVDVDGFIKKVKNYDSMIYAKLRLLEFEKTNQGLNEKIKNHVIKRFNINMDDYVGFVLGDKMILQSYNKSTNDNVYLNKLPNISKINNNVSITIQINYHEFIENIKNVSGYVMTIMNSLTQGGNCFMYMPLTFNNEEFYYFFKQLCEMFAGATVYYPTYFKKTNSQGYILFNNKLSTNKSIGNMFDKKIVKFYKKYIEHITHEYELINHLLTIKYIDEFAYKVMYNKLLSRSLLEYCVA